MCADLGIGKDPTVEVDSEIIPLPNVTEPVLGKLIDWCTFHQDDPPPPPVIEGEEDLSMFDYEIGEWDQEFLKMEDSVLFDLILVRLFMCSHQFFRDNYVLLYRKINTVFVCTV